MQKKSMVSGVESRAIVVNLAFSRELLDFFFTRAALFFNLKSKKIYNYRFAPRIWFAYASRNLEAIRARFTGNKKTGYLPYEDRKAVGVKFKSAQIGPRFRLA